MIRRAGGDGGSHPHHLQSQLTHVYLASIEERIDELEQYCETGAPPGSWYNVSFEAVLICFTIYALGPGLMMETVSHIVTNLALGLGIVVALTLAGILGIPLVRLLIDGFSYCVELFS